MNETFGDMMAEYNQVREDARRHAAWSNLDQFVEKLIGQLAPKVKSVPLPKPPEFGFDDMGAVVHEEIKCDSLNSLS